MFSDLLQFALIGLTATMAVAQWGIIAAYRRWMKRIPNSDDLQQSLSKTQHCNVAALVCVRGVEPRLRRNLQSILQQTHHKLTLHVIVDSREDSAYVTLGQLSQEHPDRVQIHLLELNNQTSGLKPLGLAQVCQKLLSDNNPPSCFAFTDADSFHAESWIDRLLNQLYSDEKNGAVTGQRWYLHPSQADAQAGTNVRRLWNIASLPQMYFYSVVWGGSWACKSESLRESGLLDSWQKSLFEDTMVVSHMTRHGQQTQTVPGLYSFSDDQTQLGQASYWIGRQLLDTRMYHSAFPAVLLHGITSVVMAISPVVFLVVLFNSNSGSLQLPLVGIASAAIYQMSNAAIWIWLERLGQHCQRQLGILPDTKRLSIWQTVQALTLTQFLYPAAVLRALVTKHVIWRGIRYRWKHPYAIERLNYHPMTENSASQQEQSIRC